MAGTIRRRLFARLLSAAYAGDPCPGNRALAVAFDVPVQTVKRDIKRLEQDGLAEVEKNGNAYRRLRLRSETDAPWSPWTGWSSHAPKVVARPLLGIAKEPPPGAGPRGERRHFRTLASYAAARELPVQALYR